MYKQIDAYVDGSYNKKLHLCSYGVIIVHEDEVVATCYGFNVEDVGYTNMRNVGGEILSATEAMKYAYENKISEMNIFYDYIGIEKWALGMWKCNNKYTQKYQDDYNFYKNHINIEFTKIKSHSGNQYNDMADQLAKEAAMINTGKKEKLKGKYSTEQTSSDYTELIETMKFILG